MEVKTGAIHGNWTLYFRRDGPALLQAPIYLVLGTSWLLPLRRCLTWMETGRWG